MGFYLKQLLLTLLLSLPLVLSAQIKLPPAEEEVRVKAYQLLEDENYLEALPQFSRLLSLYPKEPEFNFAYGACLVEENKDLDKALQYMNYVLSAVDKPAALYYIGRIWHMKYKFDDAIKFYNQFKEKAKKDDLKKHPVEMQLKMCSSGKELIRYVSILNVEVNKVIKSKDFYYSYEIDDFGGKILVKPEEYKSKTDKKKEKNSENKSLMFLSTELNVVYYSSYGENDKNGKDIYRKVKDAATGEWLPAENLGPTINTQFDEDFPYIHPEGTTLYFASKGHNSMGGYDIYKSTYDWTTNKWSTPVNMDFPTNSPYDDILYISDAKEQVAYFASNRETGHDKISVYRIKVDKNPKKKEIENFEEVIKKSKLEITLPSLSLKNRDEDIKMTSPQNTSTSETSNASEKGKYSFSELSFSDNLTADQIYKEAENDTEALKNEAKAADKDANIALIISDKKNADANRKRKEADVEKDKTRATKLRSEADRHSKDAVIAYNMAMNLKSIAEDKKKEAKAAKEFYDEITFSKNKKVQELIDLVNKNRRKITDRQKSYATIEKEIIKSKMSINDFSQKISTRSTDMEAAKDAIVEIREKVKANNDKIAKEINTATKLKLEAQNKDFEQDIESKKRVENQAGFEVKQMTLSLDNAKGDLACYEEIITELNSNKAEYAEPEKLVAKIDNTKLTSEINSKKAEVEKKNADAEAALIAENKEVINSTEKSNTNSVINTKTKEQIEAENKKIEKDKGVITSNENYNKLLAEAKKSEQVSDSLTQVILKSKQNLDNIKDKNKRAEEEERIKNMQVIADFKRQDAEKKFVQANELGSTYIALNDVKGEEKSVDNKEKATTESKDNVVANSTTEKKQSDAKTDEKKSEKNNENIVSDNKTSADVISNKTVAQNTQVVMLSVLSADDQKKLAAKNLSYANVLSEATKALRMSDSLTMVASKKKQALVNIKNQQDKQNEQEKIANIDNIASFKRDFAQKRFADVNTYEKAYLQESGRSYEDLAITANNNLNAQVKNNSIKSEAENTNNIKTEKTNETVNTNETTSENKKAPEASEIAEYKNAVFGSLLQTNDQSKIAAENKTYSSLLADANRSLDVADSLFKLADKKRAAIKNLKEGKKKQQEEEKINNLENIAFFKKQYAKKKFAEVNEVEQEFLASKNIATLQTESNKTEVKNSNTANSTSSESSRKLEENKQTLLKDAEYSSYIAEAKKNEQKSDSLNNIISQRKNRLASATSDNDKKKLNDEIASLQKSASEAEVLAEENYAKANAKGNVLLGQNVQTAEKTDNKQAGNNITANNNIESNVSSETKTLEKIELTKEERSLLVSNEKYQKLFAEASKNEKLADSLSGVAEAKKKNLLTIKNPQEKQAEQDKIANIESISVFKRSYAVRKFNEAAEYGRTFIAQNPGLKTENIVADNKTEKTKENQSGSESEKKNSTVAENNKTNKSNEADKGVIDLTKNGEATNADAEAIKKAMTEKLMEKKDKTNNNTTVNGENANLKKNDNAVADNKVKTEKKDNAVTEATDNKNKKDIKVNPETEKKIDQNQVAKNENKAEQKVIFIGESPAKLAGDKSSLSEEERKLMATNEKFGKLFIDAGKALRLADSLDAVVKVKNQEIQKIKNPQDKQAEQDKVQNIESISKFKREFAERKIKEADAFAKEYIAANNLAQNSSAETNKSSENTKTEDQSNSKTNTDSKANNNSSTEKTNNTQTASDNKLNNVNSEKNTQLLLNDNNYAQLISEAKRAEEMADSLNFLAQEKKSKLSTVNNAGDKQKEESLIAELIKNSDAKRLLAEQKYAQANNLGKTVLASENKSGTDAGNTGSILTAAPEVQDKFIKESDKKYQKLEGDAVIISAEANDKISKLSEADAAEKTKLTAEINDILTRAKNKLIEAYKEKSNSEIVKNTLLTNRANEMLKMDDVKNNRQIAERYIKDAEGFRNMAEQSRTRAVNSADLNEKLREFNRALNYERLAVKSNETAVDVLIETKPVEFVAATDLLKPDDNSAYAQLLKIEGDANGYTAGPAYNKKDVRDAIASKLSAKNDNLEILKNIEELNKKNQKEISEIALLNSEINDLQKKSANADANEKKKLEEQIRERTKRLNKKKYGIAQSVQKEHELMYNLYIKNSMSLRPEADSPLLTEGMKIESQSSENMKKANQYRAEAASEKDENKSVALSDKAGKMELLALEQQEQAFGIYMDLIKPTQKLEEKYEIAQNNTKTENLQSNNQKTSIDVKSKELEVKNEKTEVKTEIKDENKANQKTNEKKDEVKTKEKVDAVVAENKTDKIENKAEVKDVKKGKGKQEIKKEDDKKNVIAENKNAENKNVIKNKAKDNELNTDKVKPENRLATSNASESSFGFTINKNAAQSEIVMNEPIPSGIVYKVQVGAFKVPIPAEAFNGLTPLACEKLAGSQYVKYLVGLFKSEEAAKVAREEVRRSGYKDAFIVAYKDGVRVPLYLARNASKSEVENYKEIAKNEVDVLNKNIKEAKAVKENLAVNEVTAAGNNDEKKKKGKIAIDEYKNNNQNTTNEVAKVADKESVIAVNVNSVKGLLYTIQIGVFKNARTSADLMNLSPVFEEKITLATGEATKYTTGIFSDYIEAIAAKEKIVRLGIKDAYVVVYLNGKTIPLNQANVMVMKQGNTVLANAKDLNISQASNVDNLKPKKNPEQNPGAISYKVQIGAFKDQVPNDIVDVFIKVSANGGLSNFMDGEMKVYTIGEYKSYTEASKMKDKIAQQGINDAFVIVFKGARKLNAEESKEYLKK